MISYQESSRIEPHHFTATSLSAVVIWPKNTPHYRSRRWSSRVLRHLILLHRDGSRPTAVPLHLFVAQQRRWGTLAPPHGAVESSPCNSSSLLAATERVLDAQSSVVLNQALSSTSQSHPLIDSTHYPFTPPFHLLLSPLTTYSSTNNNGVHIPYHLPPRPRPPPRRFSQRLGDPFSSS